jgi:hypothetical protein
VEDAHVAQSAEHFLGKEEVMGPIPIVGCQNRVTGSRCLSFNMFELPIGAARGSGNQQ